MSNIKEKFARYKVRVARRMMRAQARSFFRHERRMDGRNRQRREGKDLRAVRSLLAELAFMKAHRLGSGEGRGSAGDSHHVPDAADRKLPVR